MAEEQPNPRDPEGTATSPLGGGTSGPAWAELTVQVTHPKKIGQFHIKRVIASGGRQPTPSYFFILSSLALRPE